MDKISFSMHFIEISWTSREFNPFYCNKNILFSKNPPWEFAKYVSLFELRDHAM